MGKLKIVAMLIFAVALIGALVSCQPAASPMPSLVLAPTPASTPAPAAKAQTLTVYSGRSESLVKPIIEQFGASTGIKVQVRYGGTSELAATILEEGKNSPADIFYAQDPGGLGAVAHLFSRLPESITGRVEPGFASPDGKWVGISGRARVVVYNTQTLKESDLPDDIWDFIDSKWKGRIGWAPTNASFQAMVTAMRTMWGEEKTRQWLLGVQANNPKSFSNNTGIVAAVGTGEIDVGFPNHYYLFSFLQQQGDAFPVRNYHPRAGGPGALVMVSGVGILETSKNKEAGERFLEFLVSPVAQQYFASQTFEYPVVKGVATHRLLKPLSEIKRPEVDMAALGDLKGTLSVMRTTGIIP